MEACCMFYYHFELVSLKTFPESQLAKVFWRIVIFIRKTKWKLKTLRETNVLTMAYAKARKHRR